MAGENDMSSARDWDGALALALRAAGAGARLLKGRWGTRHEAVSVTAHDVKLRDDLDSEAEILAVLAESSWPVLAEESGEHGAASDPNTPCWVVDPLDGTLNYSRHVPFCCVSVALSLGGAPVLGVVHDFVHGEVFSGVPGRGAWCNGSPVHVSGVDAPACAVLGLGYPIGFDYDDAGILAVHRLGSGFRKTRQMGSAALLLAHVACGRMDAYMEDDIYYWDIAAGAALVTAAGGFVRMESSREHPWARRIRAASSRGVWPGEA